jgi:hypothetical protein
MQTIDTSVVCARTRPEYNKLAANDIVAAA